MNQLKNIKKVLKKSKSKFSINFLTAIVFIFVASDNDPQNLLEDVSSIEKTIQQELPIDRTVTDEETNTATDEETNRVTDEETNTATHDN
jgi:hypothetical protein